MEKLSFRINDEYEGPLDLVLHLISKHKLDIYNIEITSLLEQYMAYIGSLAQRDIEVDSEFLEMASRLVYIKTVSLLPRSSEADELKAELTGQLLEYRECKRAAALLGERSDGLSVFVRRPGAPPGVGEYTRPQRLTELCRCYWDAVGKGRRRLPPPSDTFAPLVARPFVSVTSRIIHILRRLHASPRLGFMELVGSARGRSELVADFLAVLELLKGKRVRLEDGDDTIVMIPRKGTV